MACNHPNEALVGTADGIYCSACGAKIEPDAPKTAKKAEPDEAPAAEEKPKKAAPKKGGKK